MLGLRWVIMKHNRLDNNKYIHCHLFVSNQSVFTDRNVESDVRLMAIICLYNGIDRHWRSRVVYKSPMFQSSPVKPVLLQTCTISEEEKTIVRNALLTCIEEPISKVSGTNPISDQQRYLPLH